jgi:hypothetical protein
MAEDAAIEFVNLTLASRHPYRSRRRLCPRRSFRRRNSMKLLMLAASKSDL